MAMAIETPTKDSSEPTTTQSVFAKYTDKAYPYKWKGELEVRNIAGGIPSDPNVAAAWIKSKLAESEEIIQGMVSQAMVDRGLSQQEAVAVVAANRLNGFKRNAGGLYIEGRQLKSCIKEAASIAVAANKLEGRGWGKTNKGLLGFLSEHVFVEEEILPLGVKEPTGIVQRFIATFRGTGIQYEEYVERAKIAFTVKSDYAFTEENWAMIWLTAQEEGLGASRSQGFGRFIVTKWEKA